MTTTATPQAQHVKLWDQVIDDLWREREWALEHRGGPMRTHQEWICLIAEELGEAAKDANQAYWGHEEEWRSLTETEVKCERELIQVAQLAISAIIWSRSRRERQ